MAAVKGTDFNRVVGFTALVVITHMAGWAGAGPSGDCRCGTAIIPRALLANKFSATAVAAIPWGGGIAHTELELKLDELPSTVPPQAVVSSNVNTPLAAKIVLMARCNA